MKPKKIQAEFALLDVMRGRFKLEEYLAKGNKLKVCIHGEIDYPFGHDDGTSQEFVVNINKVTIK